MNIRIIQTSVIITIMVLTLLRCTKDKAPFVDTDAECNAIEATYELNIKPIIDNSCAYVGCHIDGGEAPGVYRNYNNMVPFFDDGSFERTVIDQRDDPVIGMPPNYSTNGAPVDLTETELALMRCWINAGYPES